jgi:hypothetical protein
MTNARRQWALTLTLTLTWSSIGTAEDAPRRFVPAPVPEADPPRPENHTACAYQDAQPFLMRETYTIRDGMSREERRRRIRLHVEATRYRTLRYGHVEGFGNRAWNPVSPALHARVTSFFGKTVRLHERVIPVLGCVEAQIREVCADPPYQPEKVRGIRENNTFHNDEASNHLYGIAIDIDPSRNKCCGCGGSWSERRVCRRPVASIFERMSIPACWVHTFERFGFYWLGRDRIQDTMHFEFLGDPDMIVREP